MQHCPGVLSVWCELSVASLKSLAPQSPPRCFALPEGPVHDYHCAHGMRSYICHIKRDLPGCPGYCLALCSKNLKLLSLVLKQKLNKVRTFPIVDKVTFHHHSVLSGNSELKRSWRVALSTQEMQILMLFVTWCQFEVMLPIPFTGGIDDQGVRSEIRKQVFWALGWDIVIFNQISCRMAARVYHNVWGGERRISLIGKATLPWVEVYKMSTKDGCCSWISCKWVCITSLMHFIKSWKAMKSSV